MLIAYLRGLLTPDYPHGYRSIVREHSILQAIHREMGAGEILQRLNLESGYISLMDPNKANKALKQHDKMLSFAYSNLNHEVKKSSELAKYDIAGLDKFIQVYKDIVAKGIDKPKTENE